MSSTNTDPTIVLDTGATRSVFAVAFHPDGIHLLGGSYNGIQRWRLVDGREVGKRTGMELYAISASRDHKWVACGTASGASVWDAGLRKTVIDVEGTHEVAAVDVSPDSTRFATGTDENAASVWSITSGERLIGPLKHDKEVTGIRFSPTGEHIATACTVGIRVFDSHNSDELINIKTTITSIAMRINTPLAWSNDGQQIFVVSNDDKIKCFGVSTRSKLAESQILDGGDHGGDVESIALATSGKFIATYARHTISFLNASTLARVGPVIEESAKIYSIALSPDGNYLATGRNDGKISVRNLGNILPDSYGPFNAHADKEQQPDEQPSTSGGHNNKRPTPEKPRNSSSLRSEAHSEYGDGGFLEVEVPSSTPAPEFDYDESLSPASSADLREDEPPPLRASHAVPKSSDAPPLTSPADACPEENANTVTSSHGIPMLKKWLPIRFGKGKKDPALHGPDRVPRASPLPAPHRSRSQPPTRVEATNEGPSWMAANKRVPRAVAKPVVNRKRKSPTKRSKSNKGASRRGQGAGGAAEAGPAQQANNLSCPSAGRIHVTDQRESGYSTISIRLPSWMLCRGSATEDGIHSR